MKTIGERLNFSLVLSRGFVRIGKSVVMRVSHQQSAFRSHGGELGRNLSRLRENNR
jgi:hypothetical protein